MTAKRGRIGNGHAPVWLVAGLALALAGCATTDTTADQAESQSKTPEYSQEQIDHGIELAERALREERLKDAQKIIERVIYHDSENARAFFVLAEVHLAEGHYQRAADEFGQLAAVPELSAGGSTSRMTRCISAKLASRSA